MEVAEIMTKSPEYVGPETTVREVLERFTELDIRHLPVVEEGEVIGMVSDRDLRSSLLAVDEDSPSSDNGLSQLVRDIMHSGALTVTGESDVVEAIDLMLEHKIGALPVVDIRNNALCGIVSYIDVLRVARDLFDE